MVTAHIESLGLVEWNHLTEKYNWVMEEVEIVTGETGSPFVRHRYPMVLVAGTPLALRPVAIGHRPTILGAVVTSVKIGWQSDCGWRTPKRAYDAVSAWWMTLDESLRNIYLAETVDEMLQRSRLVDESLKTEATQRLNDSRDFIWHWPTLVQLRNQPADEVVEIIT